MSDSFTHMRELARAWRVNDCTMIAIVLAGCKHLATDEGKHQYGKLAADESQGLLAYLTSGKHKTER